MRFRPFPLDFILTERDMRRNQLFDSDIDDRIARILTFNLIGQRNSCQRSVILDLLPLTRILLPEVCMKIDGNFFVI